MGRRHLTGIAALYRTDYRNVDLRAVCDLNRQNAEDLADEAEQLLGARPRVVARVNIGELSFVVPPARPGDLSQIGAIGDAEVMERA